MASSGDETGAKCAQCGKLIRPEASGCYYCGAGSAQPRIESGAEKLARRLGPSPSPRHLGALVGLAVLAFAALSLHSATDSRDAPPREPVDFTAEEIAGLFDENSVRAEQNWKGSAVRITGKVRDVGKELLGRPYVILDGGRGRRVQCVLNKADESFVARLTKGGTVTLTGICSSLTLGTVMVGDCRPDFSNAGARNSSASEVAQILESCRGSSVGLAPCMESLGYSWTVRDGAGRWTTGTPKQ